MQPHNLPHPQRRRAKRRRSLVRLRTSSEGLDERAHRFRLHETYPEATGREVGVVGFLEVFVGESFGEDVAGGLGCYLDCAADEGGPVVGSNRQDIGSAFELWRIVNVSLT